MCRSKGKSYKIAEEKIMFREEMENVGNTAKDKLQFFREKPAAYFLSAMLAGMFVGFGVLLAYSGGGMLNEAGVPGVKLIMGACFGVALSLVMMAGAELFTGNNFVMAVGVLQKKAGVRETALLWCFCWLGNLAGAILLAVLYNLTGLGAGGVAQLIADTAAVKMSVEAGPLFVRGILCNILVCLALWCGLKMKSETGKLIMIFWCLIAFFTAGFEHSIANMSLLMIALLNPSGAAVSAGGMFYNLAVVTAGNIVGGVLFMAVPYFLISGGSVSKGQAAAKEEKREEKTIKKCDI